jgi:hypothetical protein
MAYRLFRHVVHKTAVLSAVAASLVAAFGQQTSQSPPSAGPTVDIEQAWNQVIQNALPEAPVDPALQQPQAGGSLAAADSFANHFFFESRTNYERYQTYFTGQPTVTGVIDVAPTAVFNPAGIPYPQAFQPDANRIYSLIDFGTRGYLSDQLTTHFAVRYDQDLTHVDLGAPAQNINEVLPGNRQIQLLDANVEYTGKNGYSFTLGRQTAYGAEVASFDGGTFTLNHPSWDFSIFGGRRFSFFTDPSQRAIGGANLVLRLNSETTVELQTLWYIEGSNKLVLHRRFGPRWLLSSYLRSYGGAPVDFNAQGVYSPANGRTTLRFGFFQKLTDKDYEYDYTVNARDTNPNIPLLRLYLGPIAQYSQVSIEAQRQLFSSLRAGASVIIRRLNDNNDQGPYDTSFQDYQANVQYFPFRGIETEFAYHQHDSDRLSPLGATTFDDVTEAGETSIKDLTGQVGHTFREGKFYLSGGMYYRRISMQNRFYYLNGLHQSGALASAWFKVDQHSRVSFDYSLDNDFFLFTPDLKNSQVFRVGIWWKY